MNNIIQGDCLKVLEKFEDCSFDLIYLDPPFFTQKKHAAKTRSGKESFSFNDVWKSSCDYGQFVGERINIFHQKLKKTGSIFVHCDRNSTHIIRMILDNIFGPNLFQSEIIWYYRRWSNGKKGLLQSHQNILHYTRSSEFTFNKIYTDYSETTNIDQILQLRERNKNGKSVYKKDTDGNDITVSNKNGVPLGDVWEIPYLNPKAKERVGYPTQKPILLLERILSVYSNEGDYVLDPFCGSGTTLVASHLMNRKYAGIDVSEDAIKLAKKRLAMPIKTYSNLLEKGRGAYVRKDIDFLKSCGDLDIVPVQRNKGIDAILKSGINNKPVPIKIQKDYETLDEAVNLLLSASENKKPEVMIVVKTNNRKALLGNHNYPSNVIVINSMEHQFNSIVEANKGLQRMRTSRDAEL